MRPTKAGWILLAISFGAFIGANFSGSTLVFATVALVVSLLLVNGIFSLAALRGVTVVREAPTHVGEGQPFTAGYRLANRSKHARLLLTVKGEGTLWGAHEAVWVDRVPPRADTVATTSLAAPRRGVFPGGRISVESSYPFGLFRARRRFNAGGETVVYPRWEPLGAIPAPVWGTIAGSAVSTTSRVGSSPTFYGVRGYVRGDSLRKIHWPLSAKTGGLMVKEFEEDFLATFTVVLDADRAGVRGEGNANYELAVRVAASFAHAALANGHPFRLVTPDPAGREVVTAETLGDPTPVLDLLARVQPARDISAAETVKAAAGRQVPGSVTIFLLLAPAAEALNGIRQARAAGQEVFAVIFNRGAFAGPVDAAGEEAADELRGCGVRLATIGPGDSLVRVIETALVRGGG